jgi:hypothetical protein
MFNTRLTVAQARVALQTYVASSAVFVQQLNLVCERLINSGKWVGNVIRVTFDSSTGYITLPPYYLSVIGSTFNKWPTPIFGEFHCFFEGGPGNPRETSSWLGQLQDLGDGFCTQLNIQEADADARPPIVAEPGAILLYSGGSDNGKVVRLYGTEAETGKPVVDPDGNQGENIALAAPFVQSTKHYSSLDKVVKPHTNAPVEAWVLPMSGTANYQIASWLSFETVPRYRRYQTGQTENAIQVLCQRRFVGVSAETDWVIPGNLAALKFGLKALRHEDSGYEDKAAKNWAEAMKWLDDEAAATRGGAQPSIPAGMWGWGQVIPQTN